MSKLKSILLLCALAGGAYLWFQLSNLHIAIGERATAAMTARRPARRRTSTGRCARPRRRRRRRKPHGQAQRGNQAGPSQAGPR